MPPLNLSVQAFDPAVPFKLVEVATPAIDTWHTRSLITKSLWLGLNTVPEIRRETLELSGGMSVRVPLAEIGFKVGSIRLERVECLVVDSGYHDVLFGSNAVEQAFQLGHDGAKVASPWKDDPEGLAIQFYPVDPWVEVRSVENIFGAQRRLYNILLFAQRILPLPNKSQLDQAVSNDDSIPSELRLKLTWIESGSIWATLKSGSLKTLTYLGRHVRNRRYRQTCAGNGTGR